METWQIVFITMYGGVLTWLSLTTIQQGKKIAVLQSMDVKLDGIEKSVEKISNRFDLFIKTELDSLKELSKGK